MTWLTFLVSILAAYRIAHAIAREEGPWSVFARIRGRLDPNQATWLGRGITCAACVSVWTSLAVVLMVLYLPEAITVPLMFWLAAAGAALILNKAMSQ